MWLSSDAECCLLRFFERYTAKPIDPQAFSKAHAAKVCMTHGLEAFAK
jgi:hypothetical protein